jgi:2Fe-2S ferredoxin
MPKITFIQPDGSTSEVEAIPGNSVMETAIDNDIPGIIAECGGACSCATCHVYVSSEWLDRLPRPEPLEDGMLDCVLERHDNSRLSCQIRIDEDLDGLTVTIPNAQI